MVGCLTSKQHASVSQRRMGSDKCTCCQTEVQVLRVACYVTQSQYTDTWPTSPSADPVTPGAWQRSHLSTNFSVTGMARPGKRSTAKAGIEFRFPALEVDVLQLGQRGGG